MKKKLLIFLIVIAGLFLLSFLLPRHIVRYFTMNFADLHDHEKFDNLPVRRGTSTFYFTPVSKDIEFQLPSVFDPHKKFSSFNQFLKEKKTVAFLVVRNDTLLYENYFAGYDSASIVPSFSISKSVVSAMMGIAIDEGYIYSTAQSITFFLKELGPEFDAITIDDLLNMRSGIIFNEGYNSPFADMAKYYYGTDLQHYITTLRIREQPDQAYDYISVNSLLLAMIIERATNTRLNEYLQHKIWQPLSMESDASWSIDSKENQIFKAFCCINAIARDYAKFGRLYLNKGVWRSEQIVPQKWVEKSTTVINDSRDSQGYPYTYQWRVLENGSFFAKGILGQYIFVVPEKHLIFVRLGKKYAGIDWADLCNTLAEQL